jgi:ABC-2 type transport system permease protein
VPGNEICRFSQFPRRLGCRETTVVQKYFHAINIGFQNNLTYRFNFLTRTLFGFIPLTATIYLWQTIYAGKPADAATVATYSLSQMISYYLVVAIVDALTAVNEDDWQIAADIKDGNISQFLLKPVDYLWFRLSLFLAGRVTYLTVACVPLILFILWQREHFVLPPDFATLGTFLFSVSLTALLQFFISYSMAMLAFWVLEVSTFIFILFAFEYIASGHLFPLSILPPAVEQALFFTPFPYQLYFPVSIYMGKVTGDELIRGLFIQAGWVVAAYLLARFAWRRGIKKYSAVGG